MSDKNIMLMDPVVLLRWGAWRVVFVLLGGDWGDDDGDRGVASSFIGGDDGGEETLGLESALGVKTNCAAPESSGDKNIFDKLSSGSILPHELSSTSAPRGSGEDLGDEGAVVDAVPSLLLRLLMGITGLLLLLRFLCRLPPPNDLLTTLDKNDLVDLLSSSSSFPLRWSESSSLCFCLAKNPLMLRFPLLLL